MSDTPSGSSSFTAQNPPGLGRIAYRDQDADTLTASMLQRLRELFPAYNSVLLDPGARQHPDFGVTLVELFAHAAEILSFYQDCRANEAFLRTARLEASLREHARLIDYQPAPGASAHCLQAFFVKSGASGTIPSGFRVKAEGKNGAPAKFFETLEELAVRAENNRLKLHGHDRSERVLNAPGAAETVSVLLDQGYPGLKAGGFVVLQTPGGPAHPVQLAAVHEEAGLRRIDWQAGGLTANAHLAVADVVVLGKPKQIMSTAGSARADELGVGVTAVEPNNHALFSAGDLALFVSDGVLEPVRILSGGATLVYDRGFSIALRRSRTLVYRARSVGSLVGAARRGAQRVVISLGGGATAPVSGEQLVLSDGLQTLRARVVSVTTPQSGRRSITLQEPLLHPLGANASVGAVKLKQDELGVAGSPHCGLAPLLLPASTLELELDKIYEGIAAGDVLVLSDGQQAIARTVASTTLSDEHLRVTFTTALGSAAREATLRIHGPFEQSMRVDGYDRSEGVLAAGAKQLVLSGAEAELQPTQYLVVADGSNAEGTRVRSVERGAATLTVDLETPLEHAYALADAEVFANVAAVSHGQTVVEQILGSGDRSSAAQSFTLRQSPLAHEPAAGAFRGVAPSLAVDVGGQRWKAVRSLTESGPEDTHYEIELDERERATLRFGDGVHGARLPTGLDNVRATYRVGLGAEGNVAAGAITKLVEPLPFVQSTNNPIAASGGEDRENLMLLRYLSGRSMRTLDRAVALGDYADLALSFAGVAKARADWSRVEGRRVVELTVAATSRTPLDPTTRTGLQAFLDARRTPEHVVVLRDFTLVPVRLELELGVASDFIRLDVQERVQRVFAGEPDAEGALGFFQFERLGFGQALSLSEVYARVEAVTGVDHAVVTAFYREGQAPAVLERIEPPANAVLSGGSAADTGVGVLKVRARGGIT